MSFLLHSVQLLDIAQLQRAHETMHLYLKRLTKPWPTGRALPQTVLCNTAALHCPERYVYAWAPHGDEDYFIAWTINYMGILLAASARIKRADRLENVTRLYAKNEHLGRGVGNLSVPPCLWPSLFRLYFLFSLGEKYDTRSKRHY